MSHALSAKLNPQQAAAVELPAEHALILAGAGSGKTSVLTTRIAWLLSTGQISPSGLLAVTFTNKSAKEMLSRITAMLPLNPRGLWVGTFHGLCNRMLRLHHRDAGLPEAFAILDQSEQLGAIKRVLKYLGLDDDKYPPRAVQNFINGHKENGRRASDVDAFDDYSRQLRLAYEEYEKQCNREGVADFSELLLRCYELLSHKPEIRKHYQERFAHVLVDEFQDTNRLQYAWLKLLAGSNSAIFAVGDDDQSIYAFRGANVGNMIDFQSDFAVKHIIRLEQNYRSHGNILDAANAVISHNTQRLGKELWTEASAGELIRVFEGASDFEEAQFIVEEAQMLIRDGMASSEIAILYRSNAQSRIIEHALFSAGVPYRVYGGLRFFERQEIKHALAYLRLIANPSDDNALLRVINFPTRGIGLKSVEAIVDRARLEGCSLWQAACTGASGRGAVALGKFVHIIEAMRNQVDGLPMTEVIDMMLDLSGLLTHYKNDKEGEERVANLEELINAAATFTSEDENNLIAFLSHASLEAGDHQAGAHEEALQLMTVHAAKGLEFHAVFLSGLEEGLFPHENSAKEQQGVEEERRLMYVAITRARQRLYISLAQSRMLHGQTRYGVASRFLDEVPTALLKYLNRGYAPSSYSAAAAYVPPVASPKKSTPEHGFAIGMKVEHPKFGVGIVTDHEGGATGNVQVNFAQLGSKWLAVAYAKLKVV